MPGVWDAAFPAPLPTARTPADGVVLGAIRRRTFRFMHYRSFVALGLERSLGKGAPPEMTCPVCLFWMALAFSFQ